jgi:hypothetical protein
LGRFGDGGHVGPEGAWKDLGGKWRTGGFVEGKGLSPVRSGIGQDVDDLRLQVPTRQTSGEGIIEPALGFVGW